MQLKISNFTGNGTDNRSITGVGFQPDLVMTMAREARGAMAKVAGMTGDVAVNIGPDGSERADEIQAMESDGFQVGTGVDSNQNTLVYDYLAVRDNGNNDFATGVYTGNGVDDRAVVTGLGFQPDYIVVKQRNGTNRAVMRHKDLGGDNTLPFIENSAAANCIQSVTSDGFTVGTDNRVNGNTLTYMWFAFKVTANIVAMGNYAGNDTDNRDITGVGFNPEMVIHKDNNNTDGHALSATSGMALNQCRPFAGFFYPEGDAIQDIITDGFQVGVNRVNTGGATSYWIAFLSGTSSPAAAGIPNKAIQLRQAVNRLSRF